MFNEQQLLLISDKMGEKVHNLWMEKRRKEKGWHSPEECPNKENKLLSCAKFDTTFCTAFVCKTCDKYEFKLCPNCHPCMCPYSELQESEKELYRASPRILFDILKEMGYIVINKNMFSALFDSFYTNKGGE